MLDDVLADEVQETFWMMAKQMGKTESLNNIVGFHMHQRPAPILIVYPTIDSARKWSTKKLAPMLRDTPILGGLVREARVRDSGNTILDKEFPGGDLTAVGANSPAGLRQLSKMIVIQDEIDTYEETSEGDPCELADGRAETYGDAIFLKMSTPTIKGGSRIEAGFEQSDKQFWHVPCKKCGKFQILSWRQVKWEKGAIEKAWMECNSCGVNWTDYDRIQAINAGKWIATAPFKGIRGRHLSGLYQLIGKKKAFNSYLHQFVVNFLRANKKGRAALMVWTNTFLAETWKDEAFEISDKEIMKRCEAYGDTIPAGVLCITAGVDVQGDRLECEIVGWGDGDETWGIQYQVLPGNPLLPKVWQDLDAHLRKTFTTEDGRKLSINATGIDSGGQRDKKGFAEPVYKFCKPRFGRHIIARKGSSTHAAPIIAGNPTRGNRQRCPLYLIGTDQSKRIVFASLQLADPGPGYMHFPKEPARNYDKEFFAMLTAEEQRPRVVKGFRILEWHKTRERNEALDIRVLANAAKVHLNPSYARLSARALASDGGKTYVLKQPTTVRDPAAQVVSAPKNSRRLRPKTVGGTWATRI